MRQMFRFKQRVRRVLRAAFLAIFSMAMCKGSVAQNALFVCYYAWNIPNTKATVFTVPEGANARDFCIRMFRGIFPISPPSEINRMSVYCMPKAPNLPPVVADISEPHPRWRAGLGPPYMPASSPFPESFRICSAENVW